MHTHILIYVFFHIRMHTHLHTRFALWTKTHFKATVDGGCYILFKNVLHI